MEYVEQGSTGGIPVVFLHGVTDSWRSFERVLPPARVWQAAFAGFFDTPDFSGDLASVSAPSLIMWGDKDAYAPREHQDRLAALIPGARLIVYEGAGHGFHWEDSAQFAKDLLVFLATVSPRSAPARSDGSQRVKAIV